MADRRSYPVQEMPVPVAVNEGGITLGYVLFPESDDLPRQRCKDSAAS